ncbi:MAG TPA: hypothetical protein VKA25_01640, partial [Gemmatimonadales bacterium]|nr:hypothetical protein [Gemmatimonadales bacterium]
SIAFEGFAPSLHEYHNEARQRLPKEQCTDYREHGHEVRGESSSKDAAESPPRDRHTGKRQPDAPQFGCVCGSSR